MQSKDADHLHTKARHRRRKTAQLGVCILVCKTTAYITLNHRLACTSAHWRHQLRDTEARVPRLPRIFFSSFQSYTKSIRQLLLVLCLVQCEADNKRGPIRLRRHQNRLRRDHCPYSTGEAYDATFDP